MEAMNQEVITEALMRAETAGQAADKAMDARDAKQAPALLFETLSLTLEALAMCARAGQINALENLLPNAVYYVRVIQALSVSPFDAVKKIGIGSSIGVLPERTEAEQIGKMLERLAGGADALGKLASMLEQAERGAAIEA